MDDVVNRFAKELADAIAAAVAENPQVEACRDRAREAGFEMRVTLEAVVGFLNRNNSGGDKKGGGGGSYTQARPPSLEGDVRISAQHRRVVFSLGSLVEERQGDV